MENDATRRPADYPEDPAESGAAVGAGIFPLAFSADSPGPGAGVYLRDPSTKTLLAFFESKGIPALKEEDRQERWYADWLSVQARHGIYAGMLAPAQYSARGGGFDMLRYARFLEVFAYCSPAHGYSLQVSFLGLFAILMGTHEALKREAVRRLEAGELLAFGVSEQHHGSDLMATEFRLAPRGDGKWLANGSKYYIGNAAAASMIAVLGREEAGGAANGGKAAAGARAPFMLVALRPERGTDAWRDWKIHTSGVRAANVGGFEVMGQVIGEGDVIAQSRQAWEAVFGAVTLGKFFLGFGAIGICEHAFVEAATHLRTRMLYGKPAIVMPHLRAMMAQAYARLLAMKLYAYRALDYVHAANAGDRRYLLYCAVQKARVSTEGVKVMGLLSECIGAKGFEADTYFEMALRDAALFPGLEGSMHINLGLAGQFMGRYFARREDAPPVPPSLWKGEPARGDGGSVPENPYLYTARSGAAHGVAFGGFLEAYRGLGGIGNVALFARQAAAFRRFLQSLDAERRDQGDLQPAMALGQCMATIAYGQLVAEHATLLRIPPAIVSAIFSLLVMDASAAAMQLEVIFSLDQERRALIQRMIRIPQTAPADWDEVAQKI